MCFLFDRTYSTMRSQWHIVNMCIFPNLWEYSLKAETQTTSPAACSHGILRWSDSINSPQFCILIYESTETRFHQCNKADILFDKRFISATLNGITQNYSSLICDGSYVFLVRRLHISFAQSDLFLEQIKNKNVFTEHKIRKIKACK